MKANGVVFDGFSTLFSAPNISASLEISLQLQRLYPELPIAKRRLDAAIERHSETFDCGTGPSFDRWLSILDQVGIVDPPLDLVDWCIIQEAAGLLRHIRPLRVRPVLSELRRRNIPTAICTNASRVGLFLECDLLDLPGQVDVFVASCEFGATKQSDDFLLEPSRQLGIEPERLLFVDDGLAHLERCKKLGYVTAQAVWAEAWDNLCTDVGFVDLAGWPEPEFVNHVLTDPQQVLDLVESPSRK